MGTDIKNDKAQRPLAPATCSASRSKYKTVLLDPPWQICTGGKGGWGTPQNHYPVMATAQIINELQWMKPLICEQAHCYLWVVNNKLQDGLDAFSQLALSFPLHCLFTAHVRTLCSINSGY